MMLATSLAGIHVVRGGLWLWVSLPCYAFITLAAVLTLFHSGRSLFLKPLRLCLVACAVFFGYVLIRTLTSPDYLARNNLLMVMAALCIYLLVALHVGAPNLRGTFVALLLVVAAVGCVIGAIQFSEGKNFMPFTALPRADYGSRASGFLGSPNHFAGFLEIALLLGLSMTFWSRWRIWAKVLLGYGCLVCIAGLVITGSRGGYISAAAGLLVFLVLSVLIVARQRFDRLGYVLACSGVAALLLGCAVYFSVGEMHSVRARVETATTLDHARLWIWPSAVKQFQLNPVFGTGCGTFLYYGREFRHRLLQTDPQFAHNDYLQFLAEFGIVGAVGFLFFLVVHLRNGWRAFNEFVGSHDQFGESSNTSLALTVGALASIAALMVHSVVDFNLHIPANTLLVAFVFGLLANPGEPLPVVRKEVANPPPWFVRLALPALGLWLAIAGLPKFPGEYFAWKARVALADWTTFDTGEYAVRGEDFARRGLRSDPRNTDLLNYLGDALFARAELSPDPAERERLLQESVETYQRALQLAPQDRNIVLSLGWSLDALGRYEESEPVFQRAVALDPNSGNVRWAWAAHLHQRGKLTEAEAEYQKSLVLGGGTSAQLGLQRLTEELKAKSSAPAAAPDSSGSAK